MVLSQPGSEVWSVKEITICPVAVQLSVALAVPVTDGFVELPQGTVIAGGQVITGATPSLNVIV
jgi:hypothetical protein